MTRFSEFERSLGIAPNVLARRLASFVEAGLLDLRPGRVHVLPDKGRDLVPAIVALTEGGDRWAPDDLSRGRGSASTARPCRAVGWAVVTFPAAVLWDMDGTLVDTEPYWIATEFAMAERHGGTWSTEHALNLVGKALLDSGAYIREHMGIDLTPEQIVEELLDGVVELVRQEVPWRPGARELLADLRSSGVPCALVTMSWTRFVEPILAHLADDTFSSVVTGDRVRHGKPHPEPYLRAAADLGVEPVDCLAIEDSDPGATSAVAAGCVVLCVPHHVPVPDGERRVFRESLAGLVAADLVGLVRPAGCC